MAACLFYTTVSVNPCGERLIPLWTASDSWSSSADVSQECLCKSPPAKLQMLITAWQSLPIHVRLTVFLSSGVWTNRTAGTFLPKKTTAMCVQASADACIFMWYINMWESTVCETYCGGIVDTSAYIDAWWWMHGSIHIHYCVCLTENKRLKNRERSCSWVCDSWEGQLEERHITKELLGDRLKV